MNPDYIFNIRVTGILIEDNKILIVKQKLSESRTWSLPGGRLERGETLEQGLKRELKEETGLAVQIEELLYLCDVNTSGNTILHITFLVSRTDGEPTLPTSEYDANPIHDVRFVPIDELTDYGFSESFIQLIKQDFPNRGSYAGDKKNIGLSI